MNKILRCFLFVVVLLIFVFVAGIAVQIVQSSFRLSRNGEIGSQLVQALQGRFPGATFRSSASYEHERIYITVVNGVDDPDRPEVEKWLRAQKIERELSPELWLFFLPDDDQKPLKI
jgi:hypothetical protein